MVLNSTNIIEDSQFQALSVSAEKWVPIIQVANLAMYFSFELFINLYDRSEYQI